MFVKFAHRCSFASSRRKFLYFFSRAVFCKSPQLTERLEEAKTSAFPIANIYLFMTHKITIKVIEGNLKLANYQDRKTPFEVITKVQDVQTMMYD